MDRLDALPDLDDAARERLRFLLDAHRLTGVERLVRLVDGSRPENSAEHSWHVGLCAMVLAPTVAPGVRLVRVLEMLALHDLAEIEVGDVPIYDAAARAAVAEAEREAAVRMFAALPDGDALLALWQEFEAGATDDARYARAVDRLQPMLLHWAGGGRVWRQRGVRREQLDELVELVAGFWPPLAPLARAVIDDAAARGDFGDRPDGGA